MIKSLKVRIDPLVEEKKKLGLIWSQLKKQLISMEREEKLTKILKIIYEEEKITKKDHENQKGSKLELINSYLMRLHIEYLDELDFFYQNLTEGISEEEYNHICKIIKKINSKYKNKKKYKGEMAKLFLEKLAKFKEEEVIMEFKNNNIEYQFDGVSELSNKRITIIKKEIAEIFENTLPNIDIEFQKKYKKNLFLFYGYCADHTYKKGVFDYKNKKIYYPYDEIEFTENNVIFLKKIDSQIKEVMFYDDKIRIIGEIKDNESSNDEKIYEINNNYYVFLDKKIFKLKKEEIEEFKNLKNKKYKILDLKITQKIVDVYPICQGDFRVKNSFTKENKNKKILIDSNLNIITEINNTYKIYPLDIYNGAEKITSDLEYIIGNLGDYAFLKKEYDREENLDLKTKKATIYIQVIGDRRKLSFPQIIVEEKRILEYKKINEIKYQKDEKIIIAPVVYKVVDGIEKGKEVEINQNIHFEI